MENIDIDKFFEETIEGMYERREKLDKLRKYVVEKRDKISDKHLDIMLKYFEELR
jgi:hypothetical protein